MVDKSTPRMLIVKMLILIVVLTVAMIPMAMDDRRYPLVSNYYYRGFIGVVLVVMLALAAVYVFRNRARLRDLHKQSTQKGDEEAQRQAGLAFLEFMLNASMPITLGMALMGGVTWVNTAFDHSATQQVFTVTDSFVLVRRGSDEQYVALEVPAAMGSNRVWRVNAYDGFRNYPIGKKIEATSHDGFLGFSWCEYHDPTFQHLPSGLALQSRAGTVKSAQGFFTPGSPSQREVKSWGIPIGEK